MMTKVLASLLRFFLPGGGVLLVVSFLLNRYADSLVLIEIARVAPFLVFGLGVLLAWRLHRGRLVLALLAVALVDRAVFHLTGNASAGGEAAQGVIHGVSLLLPLNLALLALATEAAPLTRKGLQRLVVLLVQALLLGAVLYANPSLMDRVAQYQLHPAVGTFQSGLPQLALLAFVVAAGILAGRLVLRRGAVEKGLLWALMAVFLALSQLSGPSLQSMSPPPTLYFAAAGLILLISAVEASYALAYHDELTGLPARRALKEALHRLRPPYSVAMVDVDHFKRINDRHGHAVGDQVLAMIAAQLLKVTGGGRSYRYGGEEFVVLFAGKSASEARPHLESLRKTIEENPFFLRAPGRPRKKPEQPRATRRTGRRITVTVSIGLAQPGRRYPRPDLVLKAADKALYRAKAAGRNRLCR